MGLITFMSDFGFKDPYVAAVKARILSINHTIPVVDISHEIEHFNIPHAAYVLKSVFREFAQGTVHLVCVNVPISGDERLVAVKLEEHFFVGVDNGFFSLLSDKNPTAIVEIQKDANYSKVFPEKGVMAKTAVALASGTPIYNVGRQVAELHRMLNRQVRLGKDQMAGHIIHVDNYGNLISNIKEEDFTKIREGRQFLIRISRYSSPSVFDSYNHLEDGEILPIFNSSGHLEIAIRHGNAAQLLGMGYDSPVYIDFI